MRQRRAARTAVLLAVSLLLVTTVLAPRPGLAGRPLDTEDTGTIDPGAFEVELSGDLARTATEDAWGTKLVVAGGIVTGLEARVESTVIVLDPQQGSSQSGLGDSLLGLKYRLLDEAGAVPAGLAALNLRLPTGDADRGLGAEGVDVGVLAVAGKTLGPVAVNGNVGYTFATADRRLDAWTLAASIEYRGGPAWTLVAETVHAILPRGPDTAVLRAGGTWTVHKAIRLDTAVGAGLTRGSPDVTVTVGVTFASY